MLTSGNVLISVRSCRSDDSLQRVAEIMWQYDCTYVLIVDTDGCPTGIVTDRALFSAARVQNKPLAQIRISSIAQKYTLAPRRTRPWGSLGTSIVPRLVHSIPILDGEGSLVNIVTEQWLTAYTRSWDCTSRLMRVENKNELHSRDETTGTETA